MIQPSTLEITYSNPMARRRGYVTDNLILNGGFEDYTGDDFDNWTENENSGRVTIDASTSIKRSGSASVRLTTLVVDLTPGYIGQTVTVVPQKAYHLTFWSIVNSGFAYESGRYAIYDNINAEYIVPLERTNAFSASEWTQVSIFFVAPIDCTSVDIRLYHNTSTGSGTQRVWFDDVVLKQLRDPDGLSLPQYASGTLIPVSYSHSVAVNIGYDALDVGYVPTAEEAADWLESGLFRHVTVQDAAGIVWQGFVDSVTVNFGAVVVIAGPVTGIINRARMVYREMDWSTNPPVGGDTVRTQWVDNVDSQSRYSILEGVITGGEGTVEEMTQLLNTVVEQVSWPDVDQAVNFGATDISMTISCRGYGALLEKYIYQQTAEAGTQNASDKVLAVIGTDPNGFFSIDNSKVETNTIQLPKYEADDKTAMTVLKDIAARGDSAYNRYVFGVYNNFRFEYKNVTSDDATQIKYYQNTHNGVMVDIVGSDVTPWRVLPGFWALLSNISPSRPISMQGFRRDPRMMFIESVNFSYPNTLSLTGGRASTFRQKIEALGLGGIG